MPPQEPLQFETVLLRKEDMCPRIPSVIKPSCMPVDSADVGTHEKKPAPESELAQVAGPPPETMPPQEPLQFETVLLRKEDMCPRIPSVIKPSCMPVDSADVGTHEKKARA